MSGLSILAAATRIYMILLIVRSLFSWLPPRHRHNEFYRFLFAITEPVLAPARRILPPTGGMDFSPIVVIVILALITRLLGG